ncbi:MAG: bifunctional metallophosphatase/5'-nucleotidase [Acidobacteriota bacterium]
MPTPRLRARHSASSAAFSAPGRKLRALLLLLVPILGCSADPGPFELTVLHTNDVHARFQEFGRFGSRCREDEAESGACFGGVARRATAIRQVRAAADNGVLLDAGDQFQGTLFYSRFRGAAASRIMNELEYDAMVVGNHEFDDGPPVLADFAASIDFPLLATNVDTSNDPMLDGRLSTSAVIEVGDERIGLVGYITEETPALSSPGPTIGFLPVAEMLQPAVDALTDRGIDKIIAISHAGYERDKEIASTVRGLDVIVGGHTNTFLHNEDPEADGPYPTLVTGPLGDTVAVVTAFAWGKYLGRLDVTFDDEGRVVSAAGEPILLNAQVARDGSVLAMVQPLAEEVSEFSSEGIGAAAIDLRGDEQTCRFGECNLGNLIADALLAESGAQIALQNSGSIRSSIPAGPITLGNVLEVLPFENALSTFELEGRHLRDALEHGVARADDPGNDGTGRLLQVAGLRYAFRAAEPVGQRVQSIEVLLDGAWSPLEDGARYRIVSNSFSRSGGDGFDVLRDQAIDAYDQGRLISDVVIDHIRSLGTVAPDLEGRVRSLP